MSKEAMQQALEALELAKRSHGMMLLSNPPQEAWKNYRVDDALSKSITALREALSAPLAEQKSGIKQVIELYDSPEKPAPVAKPHEQEPVAWRVWRGDAYELFFSKYAADRRADCFTKRPDVEPLYTSPPASKPLTEEQIDAIAAQFSTWMFAPETGRRDCERAIARAIEAAHGIKEKNT